MNSLTNTVHSRIQLYSTYLLNNWIPLGKTKTSIPTLPDIIRSISRKYLAPIAATNELMDYCISSTPSLTRNSNIIWYSILGLECLSRSIECLYPQRVTHTQLIVNFPIGFSYSLKRLFEVNFFNDFCRFSNLKDGKEIASYFAALLYQGTCHGETLALLKTLHLDPSQSTHELFNNISTKEIFHLQMIGITKLTFDNLKKIEDDYNEVAISIKTIKNTPIDLHIQNFYFSILEKNLKDLPLEEQRKILKNEKLIDVIDSLLTTEEIHRVNNFNNNLVGVKKQCNFLIAVCKYTASLEENPRELTPEILASLFSSVPEYLKKNNFNTKELLEESNNYLFQEIGTKPLESYSFDCISKTEDIINSFFGVRFPRLENPLNHDVVCMLTWKNLPGSLVKSANGGEIPISHFNLMQVTGKYIRTYDSHDQMRLFKTKEDAFTHLISELKKNYTIHKPGITCTIDVYLMPACR